MTSIRFCPRCKSDRVFMVAGGEVGLWQCAHCDFRGAIFPTKEKLIKKDAGTPRNPQEVCRNEPKKN